MIADKTFYKDHQFTEQPVEVFQDFNCQGIHDTRFVPKNGVRQTIKHFIFLRSSNIEIDGKALDHRYGFKIDGQGTAFPIKFEGGSKNLIVNNVEITGSTHAAFPCKNELSTMPIDYIYLRKAWIHDNVGENIYWSTSKLSWVDDQGVTQYPGKVAYAEVIDVTGERSGWDAFQIKQCKDFLVQNCLFKDAATLEITNQKYMIITANVDNGLFENCIFDTAPDISHLQKGTKLLTWRNCAFLNWGKGFYSEAEDMLFESCYFKNLAYLGGTVFVRNPARLINCKIDVALKDKMGNCELIDCEFVELPDVNYSRKPWGESFVTPGTFYYQLGMGVRFGDEEVAKQPEPEQPPVEEPAPAAVTVEEAKKAWADYNAAWDRLNAFFAQD